MKRDVHEGIRTIKESMIDGLLQYLNTGEFKNNTPNAYMTAYTVVHSLSDDERESSVHLFNYYKVTIETYVKSAYSRISTLINEELIDSFLAENEKCNILNYWMKRIFTYLDKFFTKNKNKGSLSLNSLRIFKNYLFIPLKEKLYDAINKLIREDRECNVVYRYKIKNILNIMEDIDIKNPEIIKEQNKILWKGDPDYSHIKEWFYGSFSKETTYYATQKGKDAISSMDAYEYITSILKYLTEEDKRKNEYINKTFWDDLDLINNKAFLGENTKVLSEMETGFPCMFKNKKVNEIKDSYKLLYRERESLQYLSTAFDIYVRERGNELYKQKDIMKDPHIFVPELIKLNKEMTELVELAFNNNIFFQDTKNKAFSLFMGKEFYSKQLANYTDYLMKKGIKSFKEPEIEAALNEVISLFKCLNNKLTFQLEANKRLKDRLIQSKYVSLSAEKLFITKLKAESGVTYVTKMTEMMKDLDQSKIIIDSYKKSECNGKPYGINFVCQVVSQSAWEIEKTKMEKIEIPRIISNCIEHFDKFYKSKHKNQKLNWCYGLGTLDIKYLYLNKQYISTSTLAQYSLLCALEKNGKKSIEQLSNILGMDAKALAHEASGLVFNPSFNKKKSPTAGIIIGDFQKELLPTSEIDINPNFNSSSIKIQTLASTSKSKGEAQNQEREEAINVKKYQDIILQCNITRIMKGRIGKKTTHVWLISETSKQIEMFKAQPQQIKEAIEKLIEKNVIKRSEKDRTCYEYLA